MKPINIITKACILLVLSSCVVDYKKLKPVERDDYKIQLASSFITEFFTKQKNGELYQIHGGLNQTMTEMLSPERQKAGYEELKKMVGEYISMNYAETWIHAANRAEHIIRFKGRFERQTQDIEIRVTVDRDNLIAGFRVLPWDDVLVIEGQK